MPCFNKGWQTILIVLQTGVNALIRYGIVIHLPPCIVVAGFVNGSICAFVNHFFQRSVVGIVYIFNGEARWVRIFIGVSFGIVSVKVSKNPVGGKAGIGILEMWL